MQVRRLREARQRDPQIDLPGSVLCCKWSDGNMWAVLEANLESKDFRIIYTDPYDGHQKARVLGVWYWRLCSVRELRLAYERLRPF